MATSQAFLKGELKRSPIRKKKKKTEPTEIAELNNIKKNLYLVLKLVSS